MEVTILAVVGLNFALTTILAVYVMTLQSTLKSQALSTTFLKNQLTYLYERIGDLDERSAKQAETGKESLEKMRTELSDAIAQGRTEFLRENDNVRYLLKQIGDRLPENPRR